MKIKLIAGNRIAFFMMACLLVACRSEKEFTDAEREVILSQQGRIMRLVTIDNREDSLFLRGRRTHWGVKSLRLTVSAC